MIKLQPYIKIREFGTQGRQKNYNVTIVTGEDELLIPTDSAGKDYVEQIAQRWANALELEITYA